MKWILPLLLLTMPLGAQVIYAPDTVSIVKFGWIPCKKKISLPGNRATTEYCVGGYGNRPVTAVVLNVDRPARCKGGTGGILRRLRKHIKFTHKNDVRQKDMSLYRIRAIIDTRGNVVDIEYVDGKQTDILYNQIVTVVRQTRWRPATIGKEKVMYAVPLLIGLSPKRFYKTYKLLVGDLYQTYTVF